MKIKVYQIDITKKGARECIYAGLSHLKKHGLSVMPSLYKQVWAGELPTDFLEGVFTALNEDHRPKDYEGHSLSVSDVVEVVDRKYFEPGFYFCDTFGFKRLEDFDVEEVGTGESVQKPWNPPEFNFLEDSAKYRIYIIHPRTSHYSGLTLVAANSAAEADEYVRNDLDASKDDCDYASEKDVVEGAYSEKPGVLHHGIFYRG